jgi:hypothetical protein
MVFGWFITRSFREKTDMTKNTTTCKQAINDLYSNCFETYNESLCDVGLYRLKQASKTDRQCQKYKNRILIPTKNPFTSYDAYRKACKSLQLTESENADEELLGPFADWLNTQIKLLEQEKDDMIIRSAKNLRNKQDLNTKIHTSADIYLTNRDKALLNCELFEFYADIQKQLIKEKIDRANSTSLVSKLFRRKHARDLDISPQILEELLDQGVLPYHNDFYKEISDGRDFEAYRNLK